MEYDGSILTNCTEDVKPVKKKKHGQRITLHCQQCYTVLGDSFGVCGEIKCMDSIICLKVTNDVVVSEAMESRNKGEMTNCVYSPLKCRGCSSAVGKVIHSAPSCLAAVRSVFLLSKANISCYILSSSSMVKASTLTFDQKVFKENMSDTIKLFREQLDRMKRLKTRLDDRSKVEK